MWLSTKSKYGLKAIYEIGLHYGSEPVPLKTISEKHDISLAYLEQIVAILKKAGLIVSRRGPTGGYSLARSPQEITIGDIVRSLDGSFTPSECNLKGSECFDCISWTVFKKINDGIDNVVDNFTLSNLIEERRK